MATADELGAACEAGPEPWRQSRAVRKTVLLLSFHAPGASTMAIARPVGPAGLDQGHHLDGEPVLPHITGGGLNLVTGCREQTKKGQQGPAVVISMRRGPGRFTLAEENRG